LRIENEEHGIERIEVLQVVDHIVASSGNGAAGDDLGEVSDRLIEPVGLDAGSGGNQGFCGDFRIEKPRA